MRASVLISALVAAASTISARIIVDRSPSSSWSTLGLKSRQASPEALAQLKSIVPTAGSCPPGTCAGQCPCTTAEVALQPILNSFALYGINTAAEQALLLGLMAFESVDFKFNRRNGVVVPGQGTYNMMTSPFILEYAAELEVLKDGMTADDAVDALNENNDYSFGSAAWYYARKCTDDVKNAVKTGSQAGFEQYTSNCLNTALDPARTEKWRSAMTALGVPQQ